MVAGEDISYTGGYVGSKEELVCVYLHMFACTHVCACLCGQAGLFVKQEQKAK